MRCSVTTSCASAQFLFDDAAEAVRCLSPDGRVSRRAGTAFAGSRCPTDETSNDKGDLHAIESTTSGDPGKPVPRWQHELCARAGWRRSRWGGRRGGRSFERKSGRLERSGRRNRACACTDARPIDQHSASGRTIVRRLYHQQPGGGAGERQHRLDGVVFDAARLRRRFDRLDCWQCPRHASSGECNRHASSGECNRHASSWECNRNTASHQQRNRGLQSIHHRNRDGGAQYGWRRLLVQCCRVAEKHHRAG
jgi:hypothetical protein